MESKKSIFQFMQESQEEDDAGIHLPENFRLPDSDLKGMARMWADGGADGVCIYHTRYSPAPKDAVERLRKALVTAAAGEAGFEEAAETLAAVGRRFRAVELAGDFEDLVIETAKTCGPENILRFGMWLMVMSECRECVKFGLMIAGIFGCDEEICQAAVMLLGLSDEFTFFSILVMRRWEDGNEFIFWLAQNVYGWGRIHAVHAMTADTDEKKEWLLLEGINNTVMPQYSALDVYNKAEVGKAVTGELTDEEFEALVRLVDALKDEGPVPGIGAIRDADRFLEDFEVQCGIHGRIGMAPEEPCSVSYDGDDVLEVTLGEDENVDDGDLEFSEEAETFRRKLAAFFDELEAEEEQIDKEWEDG